MVLGNTLDSGHWHFLRHAGERKAARRQELNWIEKLRMTSHATFVSSSGVHLSIYLCSPATINLVLWIIQSQIIPGSITSHRQPWLNVQCLSSLLMYGLAERLSAPLKLVPSQVNILCNSPINWSRKLDSTFRYFIISLRLAALSVTAPQK